ncbi:hypothetical protein FHX56_002588 [Paraburkholderia tropica]|nr:hypothetical protein [Paraburkholderia tropica]
MKPSGAAYAANNFPGLKVTLSSTASALRARHPLVSKLSNGAVSRFGAGRRQWRSYFNNEGLLFPRIIVEGTGR